MAYLRTSLKPTAWQYPALVLILVVAALFRFYGLAWDSGYLFHPDERQILLVVSRVDLPPSTAEFFSPDSPLNPKFFAYGSLPIYLLKVLGAFAPVTSYAVPWRDDSLVGLALLGRALSGVFDLGTIVLIFLLARRLYNSMVGLIAAACIALTVLHIQLAHFYAVDTLLTFWVVATVFFAARFAESGSRRSAVWTSIAFGLALATKISAAPLIVPIVVAVVRQRQGDTETWRQGDHHLVPPSPCLLVSGAVRVLVGQIWATRKTLAQVLAVALATFVVTQPYALLDPIRYFGQVGTEALVGRGWLDYPYTRQYANTLPFVYPIAQSTVWGMGLPLGIFAWGGSALFAWQWWRRREPVLSTSAPLSVNSVEGWRDGFILSWALVYFLIVGGQYAKYLRYLLPLLPFLFLMAAASASRLTSRISRLTSYTCISVAALSALAYSLAFVSIYSREHPWLQISKWIYQNVPANATIAVEHWDDLLPVSIRAPGETRAPIEYRIQTLPMHDADDAAKLQTLVDTLATSDYILLASQRLYATIARLPSRYPISSRYYRLLFGWQLGFDLVMFERNDPTFGGIVIMDDPWSSAGLPIPRLFATPRPGVTRSVLNWGHADESFTVYDHPMPLVFKKTRALSSGELRALLESP